MTKYFKNKTLMTLISVLSLSLILVGCIEKKVNADDLIHKSIETMKALDSYTSSVYVTFATSEDGSSKVNMNALIDCHKEPFAYSNVQQIIANSGSTGTPDSNPNNLILTMILKDGVLYTNNSVTGLWSEETEPNLIKEVTDNGDFFQNFAADQFTDLEMVSVSKNKATIKARSTNSDFLKSLLNSFSTEVTGNVEMIIDIETKYIESFTYYPEIDGSSSENNKITIKTTDFNNATEVQVPKEAL